MQIDSIKNLYQQQDVTLDVLRLDLIHPVISGNKWFKLKNYLQIAAAEKKQNILTFGGAFSNHIIATAAICKQHHFTSIGVIRGERPAVLSHTLQDAGQLGMHIFFVSREAYKYKNIPAELWHKFDETKTNIIAEGGYGLAGATGAASILDSVDKNNYSHIVTAVGTGTTLAGLVNASLPQQKTIGISALKGNAVLQNEINLLLAPEQQNRFLLFHNFHFGGYAKYTSELILFMNDWYLKTGIPTDFVYTAKLFYGLDQLIKKNYFKPGSKILAIHSGGLQGNRSLKEGTLIF